MADFDELRRAMGELEEEEVMKLLGGLKAAGGEGAAEALAACQAGMDIVGKRFETGEYFVADLIYAGELMGEAAAALKPYLSGGAGAGAGKMVLCTVKGDIHDIGKNILKALLEAGGIEVIDLGVDVAPEAIVAAVKESGVKVLALSGVLTLAVESMRDTVDALAEAGLRESVKVIVGGAPITADYCRIIKADAWSLNALEGVGVCHRWLAG
ncbi:MAG: cobalamin-dependent protein [Clostridiales bacterium]|nr:cobalamin-dependent protein [Clostridiales bacterium]